VAGGKDAASRDSLLFVSNLSLTLLNSDAIGLFPGSYVEITERFLSSKEAVSEERSSGEDRKKDDVAKRATEEAAAKKQQEEAARKAAAELAAKEQKKQEEAKRAAAAAAAAPAKVEAKSAVAANVPAQVKSAGGSKGSSSDPTEQLFEARRFALFFKSALDASTAELDALNARHAQTVGEFEKRKAELEELKKKDVAPSVVVDGKALSEERALRETAEAHLVEAKKAIENLEAAAKVAAVSPAAATVVAGAPVVDEAMVAELKLVKMTKMELQNKVDSMDMELREALDKVNDTQKQLIEAKSAAVTGAPAAPVVDEAMAAELKLAKSARMEMQKRMDAMDAELREAKDTSSELKAQLENAKKAPTAAAAVAAAPVELTDAAVLQAELKMAKHQRMQLQQKVDSMDMELREAMDKAAEVSSLTKQLEDAKAKLAGAGDGGAAAGGGASGAGGTSSAELDEEKNKRVKAENALKEAKKELEEAKKAGGSSSILTIKLQAMEKELTKARTALEAAKAGPAAQLEEQTKEIKELKDKSRKLESELDVALSRAASNEEAMQQKKELRAQLDELREQLEKGKDPAESKATNPKYKIDKLEKENQELREKLLSLQGADKSSAKVSPTNTPIGSPMVKRANPVKKVAPPPIAGGGGEATNGGETAALQAELAKRDERIRELENAAKETVPVAAVPVVAAAPKKLVSMDTQVHSELRDAQTLLAKRDAQISELEGRLRNTIAQLSRAGIDTSASVETSAVSAGPAAPGAAVPMAKVCSRKKKLCFSNGFFLLNRLL
jgi:DNA repair exonuclease SbcCD ATPase subunit